MTFHHVELEDSKNSDEGMTFYFVELEASDEDVTFPSVKLEASEDSNEASKDSDEVEVLAFYFLKPDKSKYS